MSAQWLRLREPADAAARSAGLVTELRRHLPGSGPLVVHDLACGSGSMLRWLAPLLPGPQQWVGHDRDGELLRLLDAAAPTASADGATVAVDVHRCDVTRLVPDDLGGAGLITASALLDILSAAELDRLVTTCLAVGCPVLWTLSVTGEVELRPADRLDARIGRAFNAHQRRIAGDGRALLGPDGVVLAARLATGHGATVRAAPSLWRLGPGEAALIADWLGGRVEAACEWEPALADVAGDYLQRRASAAAAGRLRVIVRHRDLLILP